MPIHRGWQVRQFIHGPVDYRLCFGPRWSPALPRGWQYQKFIHKPVGYRLCSDPRRRPAMPGLGSVGSSSMNRSVTGCVPALGLPVMPRGWQRRWFIREPVSNRLCSGPRRRYVMPRDQQGRRFEHGLFRFGTVQGPNSTMLSRIRYISPVSSSNWPSLVISKTSSPSDRSLLIFRLLWSNRPHSSAPPPLPGKENPRSRAPNCCSEGGGGSDQQHNFCLSNFNYNNNPINRWSPYSH